MYRRLKGNLIASTSMTLTNLTECSIGSGAWKRREFKRLFDSRRF